MTNISDKIYNTITLFYYSGYDENFKNKDTFYKFQRITNIVVRRPIISVGDTVKDNLKIKSYNETSKSYLTQSLNKL